MHHFNDHSREQKLISMNALSALLHFLYHFPAITSYLGLGFATRTKITAEVGFVNDRVDDLHTAP